MLLESLLTGKVSITASAGVLLALLVDRFLVADEVHGSEIGFGTQRAGKRSGAIGIMGRHMGPAICFSSKYLATARNGASEFRFSWVRA